MFNTLNMIFLDVQGQIILVLVVVYCRNMNSFKLSYMSSLPARMRMIDLKMKELSVHKISPIISVWGFMSSLPARMRLIK